MFEQYTQEARTAVFLARKEAGALGAPEIAGEHLLLGLLRTDAGIENALPGPEAVQRIREKIEQQRADGERLPDSVDMPVSGDCQRLLRAVARKARKLHQPCIGTEQLLIGLLHQEECQAAQILREQGFKLKKFRSQPAPLNPSDFE